MTRPRSEVRETVVSVIQRVLREAGRDFSECTDDALLADTLRLSSLDLAVTVVSLEQELGVDPFRDGAPRLRTLGDFVLLYEKAMESKT